MAWRSVRGKSRQAAYRTPHSLHLASQPSHLPWNMLLQPHIFAQPPPCPEKAMACLNACRRVRACASMDLVPVHPRRMPAEISPWPPFPCLEANNRWVYWGYRTRWDSLVHHWFTPVVSAVPTLAAGTRPALQPSSLAQREDPSGDLRTVWTLLRVCTASVSITWTLR